MGLGDTDSLPNPRVGQWLGLKVGLSEASEDYTACPHEAGTPPAMCGASHPVQSLHPGHSLHPVQHPHLEAGLTKASLCKE